jgi:hypothetical protein
MARGKKSLQRPLALAARALPARRAVRRNRAARIPTTVRRKDTMSTNEAMGSRRSFLGKAGIAAAWVATPAAAALAAPQATPAPAQADTGMPMVKLGKYTISRLVCGNNPFNGGSHTSPFINEEMKRYYTPEQILKTVRRCQDLGVNCWQSGNEKVPIYRRLVEEGRPIHFLSTGHSGPGRIAATAQTGCIGLAMSGEPTDVLFKTGQIDKLNDYLKEVRDSGMLVGVSTHMPAVVDYVESKGWDVDYYMTCVYERIRSAAELEKLLGQAPIPVGEVYLPLDPPRMYKMIQQTKRTCLAFKILAAGRLSQKKDALEEAFRSAFANIKPGDAVIVGMYDKFSDQPAENAALVRRFGTTKATD